MNVKVSWTLPHPHVLHHGRFTKHRTERKKCWPTSRFPSQNIHHFHSVCVFVLLAFPSLLSAAVEHARPFTTNTCLATPVNTFSFPYLRTLTSPVSEGVCVCLWGREGGGQVTWVGGGEEFCVCVCLCLCFLNVWLYVCVCATLGLIAVNSKVIVASSFVDVSSFFFSLSFLEYLFHLLSRVLFFSTCFASQSLLSSSRLPSFPPLSLTLQLRTRHQRH